MSTNIFGQLQETTGLSSQELEQYLVSFVITATMRAGSVNRDNCLSWNFVQPGRYDSRLLIVLEKDNPNVKVCIESAYELFAGDTHFSVQTVGIVKRSEIEMLAAVVTKAYRQFQTWKPTYENIWN